MTMQIMNSVASDEKLFGGDRAVAVSKLAAASRTRVQEVMTTSDFNYMADLIDRGIIGGYMDEAVPTTFERLGYRRDTTDLARAGADGRGRDYQINEARLIPVVREKGEYLPIDPTLTYYEFTTYKYGAQWDLSWESWLRDGRDLGILRGVPQSWGLSARYTQEYLWTATWAAHATFFSDAQGNLNDDAGGALTAATLMAGITALQTMNDPAGNVAPYAGPITLVVPPQLEFTARQIVGSPVTIGGTTNIPSNNPAYNSCSVIVNPFLPVIDTVQGTTGWYLFADPRIRPAVRYGYLRGFEQPEVFVKEADARRLGGGSDPFDGSFLDDDIAFKLRFTFGSNLVDYRGAYWSKGTAAGPS